MARLSSPGKKQPELAFICTSSLEKPDPNTRLLIRRHVMRGKNRNKKRADKKLLKSWINQESSQHSRLSSAAVAPLYFPLPMQLGSNLLITQFAYDMPPYAPVLIFKYFTVVGQAAYPIDLCHEFDVRSSIYVKYLAVDVLFCHSALWTSLAYFDWIRGSGRSIAQIQHANETLLILQQRLYDGRLATSDVTICVVVCLVMTSAVVGDYESASKHMAGLCKMVELRGGVGAFKENAQVQLKLCRADLTVALLTDSKPMFLSSDLSWDPYITNEQDASCKSLPKAFSVLDVKLCYIWADLQEFSRSANLAFQTGQKMDCILFTEILISVQYRLVFLDIAPESTDKAIYVGMLAFSTNIFLQMKDLAIPLHNVSAHLRDSITGPVLMGDATLEFKLWLLFVARICVVTENESPWLQPEMKKTLEALNLASWKAAKERLKRYLWIDVVHDNDGRKAYEEATTRPETAIQSTKSPESTP